MNPSRTAFRATLGLAVALGLGIVVLVNWIGSHKYRRFDMTASRLYTLSEQTEKVLKELKGDVSVTVFMTNEQHLFQETRELLRRYEDKSSRVKVETIDPTRNMARAEKLVKEFGISGPSVVFKSGEKKKHVAVDQLAELDYGRARMGGDPAIKSFKGEQEFTSAILSVTQSRVPKVLFTTGHGERRFDGGRDPLSFSLAADSLRKDNCTVEEWPSLKTPQVPDGTDLVIVAGPKAAFTDPERDGLKKYLDGGGRALIFLDAEFAPGSTDAMVDLGLAPLLQDYGIKVHDDVVLDPKSAVPMMGAETFFANSFPSSHPITRPLERMNVIFQLARSLEAVQPPPQGITTSKLIETSSDGWGETDLKNLEVKVEKDAKDISGPVTLAVAAEKALEGSKKMRLAVFGDADFAGTSLGRNAANLYLLNAAMNWALERDALVSIPPKATDQVSSTLSSSDINRIALIVVVLLPLAGVALGLAVYVRRRR